MAGSTPHPSDPGHAREARLRPMGPRGEGWIGLQMLLEVGSLIVAPLTGPLLGGTERVVIGVIGIAGMVAGVLLFAWGASHLGSTFSVWVDPRPGGRLTTNGPYRYARHPVCAAQLFICGGWALACSSLVGLAFLPVIAWYLDRYKLAREEQTLLAAYPGYADYMDAVPHRMLPRLRGPVAAPGPGAA
jgi:protein-S-isoprenylcysteine O-methyltransferase Ste14